MIPGIKTISSDGPITIRVRGGNLVIKGDDALTEAQLISHMGEQAEDGVYRVGGNAVLRMPRHAPVTVEGTVGEGAFTHLDSLTLESVSGNVAAKDIGSLVVQGALHGNVALNRLADPLALGTVHGNLAAKKLHSLTLAEAHGDISLNRLEEEVIIDRVHGNLALNHPGHRTEVRHIEGRLSLSGALHDGGEYRFFVAGRVRVRVSGNVHFVVRTPGRVRFGEEVEGDQSEDGHWELFLGDREKAARVEIESEGNVDINLPHDEHWAGVDLGPDLEETMRELKRAMQGIKRSVRESMASEEAWRGDFDPSAGEWSQVGHSIGETVRTAVNDFLEALRPQPVGPAPSRGPSAAPPPPPSEELSAILQMVERGEITAEEAEQLIDALG